MDDVEPGRQQGFVVLWRLRNGRDQGNDHGLLVLTDAQDVQIDDPVAIDSLDAFAHRGASLRRRAAVEQHGARSLQ
jgi:hypothetical protein